MKRLFRLLPALLLGPSALSASTTFYTTLTSFTAAAGSAPTSFGFNSLASGSMGVTYGTAAGLSLNGFTFVGTYSPGGYWLVVDGPQSYFNDYNHVNAASLQGPALSSSFYHISNGQLTITMPPGGVTAFGIQVFDVLTGTTNGSGTDTVNMTVNGSTGSVVTPPITGTAFLGFTSSVPVTSVTIIGTATEEFPNISTVYSATTPPPQAAQTYYFSDLAFSGGFQTTLTYINYSPQPVTCVTNFYSDAGTPLSIPFSEGTVSTRTDTLQPGQSIHDQTVANAAPPSVEGWAQASCTGPVEASLLYRLYQSGVPAGEASVAAETAPTTEFATFAQTATGVAYANPSPTQSAAVTIAAYGSASGALLGSTVVNLGPLAHGSANLGPLLNLSSFTGFVKITSTIPIVSLSLNAEAYPVFSSLPPGDLPAGTALVGSGTGGGSPASKTYYFSDLAFGGGFQTTLTYINYSPLPVTCITDFHSDSGSPLSVPFSEGTVNERTDILGAGQSIHDQTIANAAPPSVEGWAEATCTGPVEASLLYRLYQSGVPAGEASVNAETAPTTEFATFAQTATGVAYANPSTTQTAAVTIAAYSAAGAPLGSTVVNLRPLAHGSANLGPLLNLSSFTGFVTISSTIPIISLSLNAEAYPVFSSLPAGDLAGGTALAP